VSHSCAKRCIKLIEFVELNKLEELDQIADQYLGKNRNVLRGKPLYLYYPEKFIPIFSVTQLDYWLNFFNLSSSDEALKKNLRLFSYLKSLPEFQKFDSWGIMRFLYDFKEKNQVNIWKIAPILRGSTWAECVKEGFIGIGMRWNPLDNVLKMDRKRFEEECEKIIKLSGDDLKMVDLNQFWTFTHEIKIGDRIVANVGSREVIGIGTVIGEPLRGNDCSYEYTIPIRWDDL
jgi:5-methylcytosine-specific restriction protein B